MHSPVTAPQRDACIALTRWGARAGRSLPWRYTGDTYELGTAEVLLQKTRAEAVLPVWKSLLGEYPTAEALMNADIDRVQQMVGGLGLGRQRAHRLINMSRAMRGLSGGSTGIGPYGSAMLALESGAHPNNPPVDGNIARVLSRCIGASWARGEARKKPEVREAAKRLMLSTPKRNRLKLAYALVDLGALVCTPRNPRCTECPLSKWCVSPQ